MLQTVLQLPLVQKKLPESLWVALQNRTWRWDKFTEIQNRVAKLAEWLNLNEGDTLPIERDEIWELGRISIWQVDNIHALYGTILRTLRSDMTIKRWEIVYPGRILGSKFIDLLEYYGFVDGKITTENWQHVLRFKFSNPSPKPKPRKIDSEE